MLNKKDVILSLEKEIALKERAIQIAFDDLNIAIANDSKSTAGDKHETGRAMIHLEQEKLSKQLSQTKLLNETLAQINHDSHCTKVQFGSMVTTNKGIYFFSVGLGKIQVNERTIFCLTITTPLGKIMSGKKKGDKINFNGEIEILKIE